MLRNFPKADDIFTALFNKTKKYFYLICRGLVRFLAERFDEGKADLKEAIENDESYNDLLFVFRIASKYYDLEDAREALEKAMEINKNESLNEVGKLFEELAESATQDDRLLFVRLMELLKTL
jgi:tetratricopeptide (TPR) repeat protein